MEDEMHDLDRMAESVDGHHDSGNGQLQDGHQSTIGQQPFLIPLRLLLLRLSLS